MHPAGGRQPCRGPGGVQGNLPEHRAGCVVSHIPAAEHHDFAAQIDRFAEGYGPQHIDRTVDPWPAFPGQAQPAGGLGPHGQDHRGEVTAQIGQRDVSADHGVAADLHPKGLDDRHFPGDQLARQAVGRHPEGQHARGDRLGFEDHGGKAQQGQIVGR